MIFSTDIRHMHYPFRTKHFNSFFQRTIFPSALLRLWEDELEKPLKLLISLRRNDRNSQSRPQVECSFSQFLGWNVVRDLLNPGVFNPLMVDFLHMKQKSTLFVTKIFVQILVPIEKQLIFKEARYAYTILQRKTLGIFTFWYVVVTIIARFGVSRIQDFIKKINI